MHWILKSFDQLTTYQLYEILALRAEVLVVEQNCPYQDLDGKDKYSHHLVGYDDNNVSIAYARLVPPDISYSGDASIGRVVTKPSARGKGLGIELMNVAVAKLNALFPKKDIRISAQSYLVDFYTKFGFVSTGKEYLEDDIPHTEMLKKG